MLASVLNSPTAVAVSIQVVRAFVRLRQMLASHEAFKSKLEAIEKKLDDHDERFAAVFEAIRALMESEDEEPAKLPIGYLTEGKSRASTRSLQRRVREV